jgi:hypothetical protein
MRHQYPSANEMKNTTWPKFLLSEIWNKKRKLLLLYDTSDLNISPGEKYKEKLLHHLLLYLTANPSKTFNHCQNLLTTPPFTQTKEELS